MNTRCTLEAQIPFELAFELADLFKSNWIQGIFFDREHFLAALEDPEFEVVVIQDDDSNEVVGVAIYTTNLERYFRIYERATITIALRGMPEGASQEMIDETLARSKEIVTSQASAVEEGMSLPAVIVLKEGYRDREFVKSLKDHQAQL